MDKTGQMKNRKRDGFEGQRSVVVPRDALALLCQDNPFIASNYITDIGYYPKARYHYRSRRNGAAQHILIYCTAGSGNVVIADKHYDVRAGEFVIIPSNVTHRYWADEKDPWTIYWVHFTGDNSGHLVKFITSITDSPKSAVYYDTERNDLFDRMYKRVELTCNGTSSGSEDMMYANMCLQYYLASFTNKDRHPPTADIQSPSDVVHLVKTYLEQQIGSARTLQQIADQVNMSASHLSFLFKRKTGFSPVEYFNHLKIQAACQYLSSTNLRIKSIADRLGIEDPQYFSRFFKKTIGVSPNIYREKNAHRVSNKPDARSF